MKIYFGSDLHLEMEECLPKSGVNIPNDGDYLILAGDVFTPWVSSVEATTIFYRFFKEVSEKFEYVFCILGNHEHYYGYLHDTIDRARDFVSDFPNIIYLDNESFDVGDISIFGSTFWTDYSDNNPQIAYQIKNELNDFNKIRENIDSPLQTYHIYEENVKARKELTDFLTKETSKKKIVVTHHALNERSTPFVYRFDPLQYAYANKGLDDLVMDANAIFIHGHMHNRISYTHGESDVMCNPRGYVGYEPGANTYEFNYFIL